MKYHILFIEPYPSSKIKPKSVTDFVSALNEQVDKAGGKIYVEHDVVMMFVYYATIVVIVNYDDYHLPLPTPNTKVIRKSFATEIDLLDCRLFKNIAPLKKAYAKSKNRYKIEIE